MAKTISIRERAKYYECLTRVLDFIDRELEDYTNRYECIGTHDETDPDTGEVKTRRDYAYVSRDYEELSQDDKAMVNAWRAVKEQIESM